MEIKKIEMKNYTALDWIFELPDMKFLKEETLKELKSMSGIPKQFIMNNNSKDKKVK